MFAACECPCYADDDRNHDRNFFDSTCHDCEPADINDDFGYDPYAGGPEMDDPIDEYDRECDNDW
jgi:hypothetical protein